jgi:hypothetical protein
VNFEQEYEKLNAISKKSINAFRNGREFKYLGSNPLVKINNKLHPTIIASISNTAFACELFLKSIIMINTKKEVKGHLIDELVEKAGVSDKLKNNLLEYDIDKELNEIDNAFTVWRYSYEYDSLKINSKFLFQLCDELENINKNIIQEQFNINMDDSFI